MEEKTFKYRAFIEKNTPHLRERLKEIGYIIKGQEDKSLITTNNMVLTIDKYTEDECKAYNYIYCGTNEELFLSIAAIRDDIDKYQWFTDGEKWVKCTEIKFSTYWVYNEIEVNINTIHKATPNELMEFYNNRNNKQVCGQ